MKPAKARTAPTLCNALWTKKPNSAKLFENRAKIMPTGKHTLQPITINLFIGQQAAESVRYKVVGRLISCLRVHPSCLRREKAASALPSPLQLALGKGGVTYAPGVHGVIDEL